jgi:hypothetical protein
MKKVIISVAMFIIIVTALIFWYARFQIITVESPKTYNYTVYKINRITGATTMILKGAEVPVIPSEWKEGKPEAPTEPFVDDRNNTK